MAAQYPRQADSADERAGNREAQMHRVFAIVFWLSTAVVNAGCATLTTSGFQTITVRTEPEGADCRFSQDGMLVARVNPTPGPILVGKTSGSMSVLCRKDGYQDTVGAVGSEFQPMTFGNILLGGLIGVVVDASTGATTKYPEAVTLRLVPHVFQSITDRDRFFDDLSNSFLRDYEIVLGRIKQLCQPENCERQLQAAEAGRAAKLAEIEQKRLHAAIGGT
jgi:hypothetical protein